MTGRKLGLVTVSISGWVAFQHRLWRTVADEILTP